METYKHHHSGSPNIVDGIQMSASLLGLNIPVDEKRFTAQFLGDSGGWKFSFPLKNNMLFTQEQITNAIYKMEEVSVLIGFHDTKWRVVEII